MLARTRREANLKRNTLSMQAQDDSKPKTVGKAKVPGCVRSYLNDWQNDSRFCASLTAIWKTWTFICVRGSLGLATHTAMAVHDAIQQWSKTTLRGRAGAISDGDDRADIFFRKNRERLANSGPLTDANGKAGTQFV